MKYNEYLKFIEKIDTYSMSERNEYVKLENIINLCNNNPFLKNYLSQLKGNTYKIYYCQEMEWDVDPFEVRWSDNMDPTFLYYNNFMEWERYMFDEVGDTISIGDGFEPLELMEEWYYIFIKGEMDKITLDDGKYIIGTHSNEYYIVDPHKYNKELFNTYLNNFNEEGKYVEGPYSDEQLNNFYHNRPHNLPV